MVYFGNKIKLGRSTAEGANLYFLLKERPETIYKGKLVEHEGTSSGLIYGELHQEIGELRQRVAKLEKQPTIVTAKIYELASDRYNLQCPVDLILKFYVDEVIAIIPDLEIYGEGSNEIEAMHNLKLELIDLYEDLSSISDNNLGKYPKAWKKAINSVIQKSGN